MHGGIDGILVCGGASLAPALKIFDWEFAPGLFGLVSIQMLDLRRPDPYVVLRVQWSW